MNLTCEADGVPEPMGIFWFRNATLLDPVLFRKVSTTQHEITGFRDQSYQGIKSVLTIRDVNPRSDAGFYSCRSSNGVGTPVIISEPRRLEITKGRLTFHE